MKELLWKIRYVLHLRKLSKTSWSFFWESAENAYPEYSDEDPVDTADEEFSCWID